MRFIHENKQNIEQNGCDNGPIINFVFTYVFSDFCEAFTKPSYRPVFKLMKIITIFYILPIIIYQYNLFAYIKTLI